MAELLRRALNATTLGGLTAAGMLVHGARDPQLILAAAGFIAGLTSLLCLARR
jgi:hypothetical protein